MKWWRRLTIICFSYSPSHNKSSVKNQGFANLFLRTTTAHPPPFTCTSTTVWPTAWVLCVAGEAVHRRIGEQPHFCTWPWCWGSPGPSLEMRGGSDNRLLCVRHGHKERGAAATGVLPLSDQSASSWHSLYLAVPRQTQTPHHAVYCYGLSIVRLQLSRFDLNIYISFFLNLFYWRKQLGTIVR